MICQYQLSDGSCGQVIIPDTNSYSGYRHEHEADWMHWASPVKYGRRSGLDETERIFKPCLICHQLPTKNNAHIMKDGHRFVS